MKRKNRQGNPLLLTVMTLAGLPLTVTPGHADSSSWNVDAAGAWATAASWAGSLLPGSTTLDNSDTATFGLTLTAARTVTVDATRFIGGISFGNTSTFGYTLATGTLRLNSGSIIQTLPATGAHTETISAPIVISGTSGATAAFTSGATTVTAGILAITTGGVTGSATAGNTTILTLGGTGTSTGNLISGVVGDGSGGGNLALVKAGSGTWVLSAAANTYSGGTTINAGTLRFSAPGAIGGSGRNVTVAPGATVTIGTAIDNAFLNRLAENSNACNVALGLTSALDLDFSSSTGANLPNAVLTGAGGLVYNGILTPAGATYRLGNPAATFGNTNLFTVANTASSALTGGNSLVVGGTGQVVIGTAAIPPTYTGSTTVLPGAAIRIDGNLDTLGGGAGTRDILIGEGGSITRNAALVNNAFLNRLVETGNAFTIYMGNASNASNLDFSSSTGANLPNASIAFYDSAGTPSFAYTGTITPANDTYRVGGIKASANNNSNFTLANAFTGARSLVVSGGNVRILNSNDLTGPITINAGNFNISGNVNASNATVTGNGSLGGGNFAGAITTNATLIHSSPGTQILSGPITGTGGVSRDNPGTAAPTGGLATPIPAGTLILTNPGNSYTGTTSALAGTLSFVSIGNVGGGPSALGAPVTAAAGTLALGSSFLTANGTTPITTPREGGLLYTGSGHTSDRVINLSGTSSGATIDASGTGPLVLTSAMTATGVGSKTLRLTGSNTANNTIGGAIVNNSTAGSTTLSASFVTGAGSVVLSSVDGIALNAAITGTGIPAGTTITAINPATRTITLSANTTANSSGSYTVAGVQNRTSLAKEGPGTWVLSGANTYTGDTTVSRGLLRLDYSSADTSRLSDTSVLNLSGGTLDLSGGTHLEIIGSTTLAAGSNSTVTRSSGTARLSLKTITPGAGARVNFGEGSIATTDNLNTNGILGTWATVGSTNWATNAAGDIVAYTGYTDIDARGSTIADGAAANVRILGDGAGGFVQLGAAATNNNTLVQGNAAIDTTINFSGKTLRSSAIWLTAGSEALTLGSAFNDGFLTAATAGGNLALINDNAGKSLTVKALMADNGSASTVTKAGPGTLILNGTNTYSGGTSLGGGTLVVANNSALGTGPLTILGGALAAAGNIGITNPINANMDFGITGSGALTLSGPITLNTSLTITNENTTEATTLTDVSGANQTLTIAGSGNTLVSGVIGTGTAGLIKSGPGRLVLTGNNSFTGACTINGGTLELSDTGLLAGGNYTAAITLATGAVLDCNSSFPQTLRGILSGGGSLIKQANGSLTLTAASTYTGGTTLKNGLLFINNTTGSGTGTGAVTVSGGTLGGTGRIGGNLIVTADGNLAPGASAIGTLSIGGGLDLSAMATGSGQSSFELEGLLAPYDKIAVTGTFTIGSGVLGFNDFSFLTGGGVEPGTYTLISSGGVSGTLDPANLTGPVGNFSGKLQINGTNLELVVTSPSGYAMWNGANAGGQGPNLDWDGDGVGNGVEYFMNAPAGFTANPSLNAGNTITWPNGGNIPASAYGTQFVVQTSSDMQSWLNVPSGDLTSNSDGPGGTLSYTLTGSAPRFVRLKVTPN